MGSEGRQSQPLTVRPGCSLGKRDEDQEGDVEEPAFHPSDKGAGPGDCAGAPMGLPQLQSPSCRQHAAVWNSVYFLELTSPSLGPSVLPAPSLHFPLSLLPQSLSSLFGFRLQPSLMRSSTCKGLPETSPRSTQRTTSLFLNECRFQRFFARVIIVVMNRRTQQPMTACSSFLLPHCVGCDPVYEIWRSVWFRFTPF